MNAVERLWHYSHNIPQEPARALPGKDPQGPWPTAGQITFEDVRMTYRAGLEPALQVRGRVGVEHWLPACWC